MYIVRCRFELYHDTTKHHYFAFSAFGLAVNVLDRPGGDDGVPPYTSGSAVHRTFAASRPFLPLLPLRSKP